MSVQADVRNDRRGWLRELVAFATNPLLLSLLLVSLVSLVLVVLLFLLPLLLLITLVFPLLVE
jgi:hypothetical protein